MKKTNKLVSIGIPILLLTTTAVGSYLWVTQPQIKTSPTHGLILLDLSDSMAATRGCNSLRGLFHRFLAEDRIGKDSTITIWGTGSPSTAFEPVPIISATIPVSTQVLEGKEAISNSRKELLLSLLSHCQEMKGVNQQSPIFLALKRGLEQLRAIGCGPDSSCNLYVRTDGEETQENWFKRSLKKGKILGKGKPSPLNNAGVIVNICGLSETRGITAGVKKRKKSRKTSTAQQAELIRVLWQSVFTHPENLVFEPVCPQSLNR